jgi:hypothetical protein
MVYNNPGGFPPTPIPEQGFTNWPNGPAGMPEFVFPDEEKTDNRQPTGKTEWAIPGWPANIPLPPFPQQTPKTVNDDDDWLPGWPAGIPKPPRPPKPELAPPPQPATKKKNWFDRPKAIPNNWANFFGYEAPPPPPPPTKEGLNKWIKDMDTQLRGYDIDDLKDTPAIDGTNGRHLGTDNLVDEFDDDYDETRREEEEEEEKQKQQQQPANEKSPQTQMGSGGAMILAGAVGIAYMTM